MARKKSPQTKSKSSSAFTARELTAEGHAKYQRVVDFFQKVLRHSKGQNAGKPFMLLPWQHHVLRELFGRLNPDRTRQHRVGYIELPKMKGVLLIAVLLRFMDSFMIYTEPFVVTGGGPGNATTFLSIDLAKMATGQFDLGPAAAFSIMYFLVILLVSWVFYTVMTNMDRNDQTGGTH